jgi:hypothetical protein
MNNTLLIALAVAGIALILIGATARRGPKITTIETRREDDKTGE